MMDTNRPYILTAVLFLLTFNFLRAQELTSKLDIGDQLPDIVVKSTIGQSSKVIRLKDLYKEGLLIIDFWATWCKPCLQEMKYLDSLKGKNPEKFNVLLVTSEDSITVERFFARPANSDLRQKFTFLTTNDKMLAKLFPHRILPHNVWIDKNGIITAITSSNEITEDHIFRFSGNSILKKKVDQLNFDPFKEFHYADSSYTYRSIISPHLPGVSGGSLAGGPNPRRALLYNLSISHLFWVAFSNNKPWRNMFIEIRTQDSSRFLYPINKNSHLLKGSKHGSFNDWMIENTYCYALTLPNPVPDTVFRKYMLDDLTRQFNVKVEFKKKNIMSYVISANQIINLKPGNLKNEKFIGFIPGNKIKIGNRSIKDLIEWWWTINGQKAIPEPYFLELGSQTDHIYDDILDFSKEPEIINGAISHEMFCRVLSRYGLNIGKSERQQQTLILQDLN